MVKTITALDRVFANAEGVNIALMQGSERVEVKMSDAVALDIAHSIADALKQLREPGVDQKGGVALYEATKFEADLETKLTELGVQEKVVLTAHGQGSTKITLRLSPEKVDAFLGQMEMHASRRRGDVKN